MNDVLSWIALALALAANSSSSGLEVAKLAGTAAGLVLVLVVLAALADRHQRRHGALRLPWWLATLVVGAGLAAAAQATNAAGLHYVFGAFAFGVLFARPSLEPLARAPVADRDRRRPRPAAALPRRFRARRPTSATSTSRNGGEILVVLVVAAASKLVAGAVSGRATGLSRHDALSVGVLLNTRGLVELVALGIGLSAGLLDESLYAVLADHGRRDHDRDQSEPPAAGLSPRLARIRWPTVAIETRDDLQQHLQWAIELEHSTLPPYLTALYSIKDGTNREAIEIIHSVFIEEMLHLTLAANILNAVGGAPNLDYPGIMPSYPTFLAHSNEAFQVGLAKFSTEALETFLQIERPGEHDGLPEDDNFETIGQFYEAIEEALKRMAGELGEAELFNGDPARQVTDALYYGGSGRIVAVTDLDSALHGARGDRRAGRGPAAPGDLGRRPRHVPPRARGDRALLPLQRALRRAALPARRHAAVGPDRRAGRGRLGRRLADAPEPEHRRLSRRESRSEPQMEEFKHAYTAVLHLLHECFNGSPRLLAVATGLMYGLKDEAVKLMQLDSGDGETTVGPPFEWVPHAAAPPDRQQRAEDRRREGRPVHRLRQRPAVAEEEGHLAAGRLDRLAQDRDDRDRGHVRAVPLRAVRLEAVLRRHARARRLRRHRDWRTRVRRASASASCPARWRRTARRCSRARGSS